jgi:hypothetical protein
MGIVQKIVGVGVGLLVAATIVPLALVTIATASHTDVDASVWTVFSVLLPILAIIGLALYFMPFETE